MEQSQKQYEFLLKVKQKKLVILIIQLSIFFCFLTLWEMATYFNWIDSFFFSSPSKVFLLFLSMSKNFEIFYHIWITLYETLLSFFLVNLFSISFALFLYLCKNLATILEPFLVVLNSLPKSALAPLIIVWLGTGKTTIIIAGISVALFGSIMTLYSSFHEIDEERIKLITTLGGTPFDQLTKLVIPSTIPVIISNMKVTIGLSLVGVIIGEFLAARNGLGYLIIYASQVFKLDLLILSIIILCFIALLLYQIIQRIETFYTKK
ncbi:MAG: ABC transporter permease [Lachnospiraceae bacterium]